MSKRLVGIDLGGTNIRAALAESATSHGPRSERRSPAGESPESVVAACVATALDACGGEKPDGVAVGIPGPLNPRTGVVFAAPNLGEWDHVDARRLFADALGCPVAIQNDAKLAGYAEWVSGAGAGTENMIFITVSTGIGAALIFDGRLYGGAVGASGEIGHLKVGGDAVCALGHRGCLEAVASGTAIGKNARDAVARGEKSSMSSLDAELIDGQAVNDAAQAGDSLARRIIGDAGGVVGTAIGSLINLLNPEVVVVGGGVMDAGELFFDPLRQAVAATAVEVSARACRVVAAGLGTDAGLAGACAWAWKNFS
jgi:glucokinase